MNTTHLVVCAHGIVPRDCPYCEVKLLRQALRDLLSCISADELISESVSYMRQARAALGEPMAMGNNQPGDDFVVIGSGYEAGFDAGYAKGFADGMDESAGDPRVERLEAGFKAMYDATNGEFSREDMIVLDALQAARDFAVRLARREQHIQQLISERADSPERLERLVLALQAHAREQGWQDVDEPIATLLSWRSLEG